MQNIIAALAEDQDLVMFGWALSIIGALAGVALGWWLDHRPSFVIEVDAAKGVFLERDGCELVESDDGSDGFEIMCDVLFSNRSSLFGIRLTKILVFHGNSRIDVNHGKVSAIQLTRSDANAAQQIRHDIINLEAHTFTLAHVKYGVFDKEAVSKFREHRDDLWVFLWFQYGKKTRQAEVAKLNCS